MRAFVATLVLLLVVGGLGLFSWMTQHPEAAWIERAEEWPGVGRWAEAFRRKWLPPEARGEGPPPSPRAATEPEIIVLKRQPKVVGVSPYEWVTPGSVLYEAPDETAAEVERFDMYANLSVLERRGEWARLRHGTKRGWLRVTSRDGPILGSAPAPNLPLPGRPPDAERLARARSLLGEAALTASLGPYTLWTDVEDRSLLALLGNVASTIEPAYRERYGRSPVGLPGEAVILFDRQALYRRFQDGESELLGLPATGHAGHGLAALFVSGRPENEVASTLAHELTHLLNRRALGPALPPWLDEGIAGDLGGAAVTAEGRLDPNRPGGEVRRGFESISYSGTRASLLHLRRAIADGRLMPLQRLTELEWRPFVLPLAQEKNHEHSSLFIRYLLEGESGALAPGFRAFLASIAEGGPATGEALLAHLDRSWSRLEAGFRAYVTQAAFLL